MVALFRRENVHDDSAEYTDHKCENFHHFYRAKKKKQPFETNFI